MEKKRVYRKPVMESETFVPSAYCAICFKIGCEVRGKDWQNNKDITHSADACGDPSKQYIVEGANGRLYMEEHSDDQGSLPCQVISPSPFTWDAIQDNGNKVEWTTTSKDGKRTWYHWGYAEHDQSTSNAS